MKFSDYTNRKKEMKSAPPSQAKGRPRSTRYNNAVHRTQHVTAPPPPPAPPAPGSSGTIDPEAQKRIKQIEKVLSGLLPNEIIYPDRAYRHHWITIVLSGWLWFLTLIILATLFILGLAFNWGGLILFGLGFFLTINAGIIGWLVVDWSNDWLIATNLRICYIEKIPFIFKNQRDVMVKTGPSVEVETRRDLVEFFFRIGNIRIVSQGQQPIIFKNVYKPRKVREDLDKGYKGYFAQRNALRREILDGYVDAKARGETPALITNEGREVKARKEEELTTFQRLFPFKPVEQVVRGNLETRWHTHWIVLVTGVVPPLLYILVWLIVPFIPFSALSKFNPFLAIPVWFLYIIVIIVGLVTTLRHRNMIGLIFLAEWAFLFIISAQGILSANNFLLGLLFWLFYILTIVGLGFLIWYRYEDWINDSLVVGFDGIIKEIRSPFGFDAKVDVIRLTNIQDADVRKPNVLANLLNYGDVTVTPAGKSEINFKNIPNPEEVSDEIDRKREEWQLRMVDTNQDRLYADFFVPYFNRAIQRYMDNNYPPPNRPRE